MASSNESRDFFFFKSSHRLLEGTLHERSCVLAVDAVTSDGHQVTAARHGVAEQSQVAVVDVGAVEGDDVVQLPLQCLSNRLNSQHLHTTGRRGGKQLESLEICSTVKGKKNLLASVP